MGIGVHNFAVNLKLLYKMKILKKKKTPVYMPVYSLPVSNKWHLQKSFE